MSDTLKIRSPRFEMAIFQFVGNARRLPDVVVNGQMRLLVRDIIRITPPNQNYALNKGAGVGRIRKEISGIMVNSRRIDAEDPRLIHARYRSSSTGRINRKLPRDERHRVNNLAAYIASQVANVGILSSGWVPAAKLFGLELPAWITRHGNSHGEAWVKFNERRILVHIANRVFYAPRVKGLDRRVRHAAENRAIQMEKQTAAFLFGQAARRAGFRVVGAPAALAA